MCLWFELQQSRQWVVWRTHKMCSSTLPAPAWCSPAQPGPAFPHPQPCGILMSPSQGIWGVATASRYLTIAFVLASLHPAMPTLYSAHLFFLLFSPSCIIQLSFSSSAFASSFSPHSSYRRRTASWMRLPCKPQLKANWKEEEGRQPYK